SADAPEQLRRHRRAAPVKRESAASAAGFGTEDDPCVKFCREQRLTASGGAHSGYWFAGARLWPEPRIEKSVPEPPPGGPVMSARHHIDPVRRQGGGHQGVAVTESVLAAKSEVHGQGPRAEGANEAPDTPLVVVLGKLSRVPVLEAVRTLDFGGDQVTAEIGRKEAQTGELTRIPFGVAQCEVAPERDAAHPHCAPQGVCRQEDLFPQPREETAVTDLL